MARCWKNSKEVNALLIVNTDHRTTERSTSDSLGNVSWFRMPLYSCTEGMCHSFTHPGTSLHVTQFYQAFPRVSSASNKRWGEKAWVRG